MKLPRDGKIYWMKQGNHQESYDVLRTLLVPERGPSEILCGELLRVWSRFYHEYYTLGSLNLAVCKNTNPDRHPLHKVALWFSNNCACLMRYDRGVTKKLMSIQSDYRKLFTIKGEDLEAIMDVCVVNAAMVTLVGCLTRSESVIVDDSLDEVVSKVETTS